MAGPLVARSGTGTVRILATGPDGAPTGAGTGLAVATDTFQCNRQAQQASHAKLPPLPAHHVGSNRSARRVGTTQASRQTPSMSAAYAASSALSPWARCIALRDVVASNALGGLHRATRARVPA